MHPTGASVASGTPRTCQQMRAAGARVHHASARRRPLGERITAAVRADMRWWATSSAAVEWDVSPCAAPSGGQGQESGPFLHYF